MATLKDSRDCASFITLDNLFQILGIFMKKECLKGHCIEFKYYADGIHSGLTPPG